MRTLLLCFCLLVLPACSLLTSEEPPVDDNVLVNVLIEFHLLDTRVELGYDIPESIRDSIFEQYGLTEAEYEEAIAYYADRPEEYLHLYRRVVEELSSEHPRMMASPGAEE